MSLIRVEKLKKSYNEASGKLEVLRGVDLEIQPGEMIAITGESGSGKSEMAQVLMEGLVARGNKVLVLGQDDYFKLPPHSNHQHRNKDISRVSRAHLRAIDEDGCWNHGHCRCIGNKKEDLIV